MQPLQPSPHFAFPDPLRVVADDAGGAAWEICSGGVCLRDRDGCRLMSRYRDLLVSQGRPVPIS
jgi:hypothetical protein